MYVNDTGLPSVTQILKPHLDTDWFTPESAERGSAVHAAASAYLQGLFVPPLPEVWNGYFVSAKRWIDGMVKVVVLVEERLISRKYGFCGKPDLIAVLNGTDFNTLIDFKTSIAIQRWWSLQNSAYRLLAKEDKGIITQRGISVRLKVDGSGGLATDCGNYQKSLNVFLGELNSFNYFKAA